MTAAALDSGDVALVDLLDRLLGRGVTIAGDIVISVAGVDLVYLDIRALIASVDAVVGPGGPTPGRQR